MLYIFRKKRKLRNYEKLPEKKIENNIVEALNIKKDKFQHVSNVINSN